MGMGRTWGRLYSGTRNHRKIKILAQRHPVLWMAWYVLLEMSFEIDDDGWIYVSPDIPYSFKELAKELRIRREDHLKNLCTTLEELGMIAVSDRGIQILSYSERNFETDSSTPRVQKYRERQKEETLPKRFCNGDETEARNAPRTDTETETEQNRKKSTRAESASGTLPESPGPEKPLPSDDGLPAKPPGGGNGVRSRCNYRLDDFEKFYQDYPKKTARKRAEERWRTKIKQGRLPPLGTLLSALEKHKNSRQWRENIIPHPATWLSEERWNDLLETEVDPWNAIH